MQKKIFLIILTLFSHFSINAIPTSRVPMTYRQIDGTEISLICIGDESFHFQCTTDMFPVLRHENGSFYYACIKNDSLVCSQLLAHNFINRSIKESEILKEFNNDVRVHLLNRWNAQRKLNNNLQALSAHTRSVANPNKFIGKKKGLVILVDFPNCHMLDNEPNNSFYRMFNQIGYCEDNHIGSVHDYFMDQSYGLFDLTFDIVGPVTMSRNYGYYGQNITQNGSDKYPGKMVIEACQMVDEYVNFEEYDWDNDGIVETVFVLYAGYGENSSQDSGTIWPHKSSLSGRSTIGDGEGTLELDGVKIDIYACSSELAGSNGSNKNGIGTACHEFSHCLGLPDLYDTDYSGAFGMNKWDVMDAGSYSGPNGRGEIPYGYSAFERACAGWLEFEEVEGNSRYALQPLNDCPHAYILPNTGCETEFFVLENHQPNKWFSYIGTFCAGHGMMVTHIDYNEASWKNNSVNTSPSHMRQSIIPADNDYGAYYNSSKAYYPTDSELQGDLFPGSKDVHRLSGHSHYNTGSRLFNMTKEGAYIMNLTLDNIMEDNGIISFSVGENIACPQNVSAYIDKSALTISWEPVYNAENYSIEISKIISVLPNQVEIIQIDDIQQTEYIFNDVQAKICNVKVKAKNAYVSSEWSDLVRATSAPNAIHTIENDNEHLSKFYDINGHEVKTPRNGIYIKTGGKTSKIYIK